MYERLGAIILAQLREVDRMLVEVGADSPVGEVLRAEAERLSDEYLRVFANPVMSLHAEPQVDIQRAAMPSRP